MSPTGVLRLDSRESVERALSSRTWLRVFLPRLEVVAPAMDPASQHALQSRVDALVDECGCGPGAAVALLSLAAWLGYAATIGPAHGVWGNIWRCAAVTLASATLGKVVGVGRARLALRRELVRLRQGMA